MTISLINKLKLISVFLFTIINILDSYCQQYIDNDSPTKNIKKIKASDLDNKERQKNEEKNMSIKDAVKDFREKFPSSKNFLVKNNRLSKGPLDPDNLDLMIKLYNKHKTQGQSNNAMRFLELSSEDNIEEIYEGLDNLNDDQVKLIVKGFDHEYENWHEEFTDKLKSHIKKINKDLPKEMHIDEEEFGSSYNKEKSVRLLASSYGHKYKLHDEDNKNRRRTMYEMEKNKDYLKPELKARVESKLERRNNIIDHKAIKDHNRRNLLTYNGVIYCDDVYTPYNSDCVDPFYYPELHDNKYLPPDLPSAPLYPNGIYGVDAEVYMLCVWPSSLAIDFNPAIFDFWYDDIIFNWTIEIIIALGKIYVDSTEPWHLYYVHGPEFNSTYLWWHNCEDYLAPYAFIMKDILTFKNRICDDILTFQRAHHHTPHCSCDLGEIMNTIHCCPQGWQCLHRWWFQGSCNPGKQLIDEEPEWLDWRPPRMLDFKYATYYTWSSYEMYGDYSLWWDILSILFK